MKFDKEKVLERVKARGEFPSEAELTELEKEISDSSDVSKYASDVRKHVEESCKVPGEQLTLSFMPTDMTRTSPFFPMSKREMKDRSFKGLKWETAWSSGKFIGPKFSIYDESVLFALFALVRGKKSHKFSTTRYEICKKMGVKPQRDSYKAIMGSLFRLRSGSFFIEYIKGKGANKELVSAEIWGFLYRVDIPKKTKPEHEKENRPITITVDPYFLKTYSEGMFTNIDMEFRAKIKGDIAKAIYRFLQGQSPFQKRGVYKISLEKLSVAINLNLEKPTSEHRKQIRKALKELRKQKYIERWMISKNDIIHLWRGEKAAIEHKPDYSKKTIDGFKPAIKKGVRLVDADPDQKKQV
jgi:hypothetical protein